MIHECSLFKSCPLAYGCCSVVVGINIISILFLCGWQSYYAWQYDIISAPIMWRLDCPRLVECGSWHNALAPAPTRDLAQLYLVWSEPVWPQSQSGTTSPTQLAGCFVSPVWWGCRVELETKVVRRFPKISPTRAFSWLKVPNSAFTFKTLLRHYTGLNPSRCKIGILCTNTIIID